MIDRLPQLDSRAAYAKQAILNALIEHRHYITPMRMSGNGPIFRD